MVSHLSHLGLWNRPANKLYLGYYIVGPVWVIIACNHEVQQLVIAGFQRSKEQAEQIAQQRCLGDPHIILEMFKDANEFKKKLMDWLIGQRFSRDEAQEVVRSFGKQMLELVNNPRP